MWIGPSASRAWFIVRANNLMVDHFLMFYLEYDDVRKGLLACWNLPKRLNLGTKFDRGCFFNHCTFCCTSWTAITFVVELLCSLRMLLGDEAIRSSLLLMLYKKSSMFYVVDCRHVCICRAGPQAHASFFPFNLCFWIVF